jgi:hypothetical protein
MDKFASGPASTTSSNPSTVPWRTEADTTRMSYTHRINVSFAYEERRIGHRPE